MDIASYIDSTNVKPEATAADIKKLCAEAIQYKFHSVCVTPFRVKEAKAALEGQTTDIICVIGFPYGFTTTEEKINEAKTALGDGATEIDMVINIGAVKDGNWQYVEDEIRQIAQAIAPAGLKVIMEIGFLTRDELVRACETAKAAGAAFVKTSTGFGPRTPTIEDIKIMRQTVGEKMGVKASGGIHTLEQAQAMIQAGANRIGTSSALQIIGVKEAENNPPASGNARSTE